MVPDTERQQEEGGTEEDGEIYLKSDMRAVGKLKTIDDRGYTASVMVHLSFHRAPDDKLVMTTDYITVNGEKIAPTQEEKGGVIFQRAMGQASSVATYMQLYAWHPQSHFPLDCANAVTKHLPKGHVLSILLRPHFKHSMVLNDTVQHDEKSPLISNPLLPWNVNAFRGEELSALLVAGNKGCTFQAPPVLDTRLQLGRVYAMYYTVILRFVRRVLEGVDPAEEAIQTWANGIADASETFNFPTGEELREGGNEKLVVVVATIIWTVSVCHSLDHLSMFHRPRGVGHMQVHVPPPGSADVDSSSEFEGGNLCLKKGVLLGQEFYEEMYVNHTSLPSLLPGRSDCLLDVRYQFLQSHQQKAVLRFKHELVTTSTHLTSTWKSPNHLSTAFELKPSVSY